MRLQDYVQITAAAELLGVAPNTLRNWERSGKIRVYRHPINNYRLYKRADLAALLAAIEPDAHLPSAPPKDELS